MSTRRITVKQSDNTFKKVAFLDDVTLNGLTGTGLISVNGDKEKVVTTDTTKLTLQDGNVKVVTPLVLDAKETAPSTTTNALYSVNDGTESKLYWNGKLVDAHAEGEGYVLETTFSAHVDNSGDAKHVTATELGQLDATAGKALATQEWASAAFADKGEFNTLSGNVGTLEGKVTAIEENYIKDIQDSSTNAQVAVSFGKSLTPNTLTTSVTVTTATQDSETKALSGDGLVTGAQAQDAIDAGVNEAVSEYNTGVVGVWSTITDKTVKAAIEENKAKIAALEGNHFIVVDTLPAVGQPNCIYLIPKQGSETGNIKEEWIYVNNAWEKIGDTAVDLSEYAKTTVVETMISNAVAAEEERAEGVEATLSAAVTAAQSDVDNLETLVGTLPAGVTATTVVGYVDEKAGATVGALRDTADTASASDGAGFVTVGLTGTVGNHGLTVTASNIAKASEVGDVSDLTTTAKDTVVAAVNEVKTAADAAKSTADAAKAKADTAVQTASGDANITASVSNTALTVGVKADSTLADLLAYCSIVED